MQINRSLHPITSRSNSNIGLLAQNGRLHSIAEQVVKEGAAQELFLRCQNKSEEDRLNMIFNYEAIINKKLEHQIEIERCISETVNNDGQTTFNSARREILSGRHEKPEV